MFGNTLSNEEMTKIKVVDLDELNNFCIHHFYIFITFYVEIILGLKFWFELVIFKISKFERFKFSQMTR